MGSRNMWKENFKSKACLEDAKRELCRKIIRNIRYHRYSTETAATRLGTSPATLFHFLSIVSPLFKILIDG